MPVTLICEMCGSTFTVIPSRKNKARFCGKTCSQTWKGRLGGKVTGEIMKSRAQGKAYTKISGRHKHRVIAEQMLGRKLYKGEVVHHKDRNKLNNDPSNLEIMTQSEHARLHMKEMRKNRKNKKEVAH